MGDLLINLAVAILDDLLSHGFTVSPVAMAYTDNLPIRPVGIGILLSSHTDELVNHPKKIWTILLLYGWASKP